MSLALVASYSSTASDDFIIPEDHIDRTALPENHAVTKKLLLVYICILLMI